MANESIPEQQRKLVELSLDSYKYVWSGTFVASLFNYTHTPHMYAHAHTHNRFPVQSMVVRPEDGVVLSQLNANELLDHGADAGIIESLM